MNMSLDDIGFHLAWAGPFLMAKLILTIAYFSGTLNDVPTIKE